MEAGKRWDSKSKLHVGAGYGNHHFLPKVDECRDIKDSCPTHSAYSAFKATKNKNNEYAYNQIKTEKAYRLFKYYVQQFYARLKEIEAGYEKGKALAEPHQEYLSKLDVLSAKQKDINDRLWEELNPDAHTDCYKSETISVGDARIWLNHVELNSPENIDVTSKILDLVGQLKYRKNK